MKDENNEMWVFLSHSHKDYEKVSLLRNLLEESGYRPIMFYLKCLDDDSEIDSLIKREIDSRAFFILCDSKNSRISTWVQEEEKYIKSKGRVYEIVDIESDPIQIKAAISRFQCRTSAFISYSRYDLSTARMIQNALDTNGYTTWIDRDHLLGGKFENVIENSITKHSNEGFVVILLSEHYIKSNWCMRELQMALGKRETNASSILMVSLDGIKPYNIQELRSTPVRWIDATNCSQKQIAKKIVSFFNFYNTSYRKIYNLCWEMSKIDTSNTLELQELPYPLPDNIDKTMVACRYILGIGTPTDIDYAMELLYEAALEGDENATNVLKVCKL